jgi:predicted Ser/Thr protein kinase
MAGPRPLPTQFRELAPFVADWALTTEAQRLAKLTQTSIAELKVFYDAIFARAEEIRAYLDGFRLNAMPEDAQTLLDLLLTFIETAHPIELNWTTTDIDDAFALERMTIEHFNVFPPS